MIEKRKILTIITVISLFLVFLLGMQERSISDLQLNNLSTYKEPSELTFLDLLGLSFLNTGLSYEFGVTEEVIEEGFKQIFSMSLNPDNIELETLDSVNYDNLYEITYSDTLDANGNKIENDRVMTITTPVGINSENIETTSNAWILNYRLYNGGLTGLRTSYWYSQLFEYNEDYFNKVWDSLRWLCDGVLNCKVISNDGNTFEALFYGETYNWYLYLDKINADIFNIDKPVNAISMKINPISEKDSQNLIKSR